MNMIQQWLSAFFKRKQAKKQEIGELPPEILARIAHESAFLRGNHQVEVRDLEPGEEAGKPRAVDPSVEESLPFMVAAEKPAP